MTTGYQQGFLYKCASRGIDEATALYLLKTAQAVQPGSAPAAFRPTQDQVNLRQAWGRMQPAQRAQMARLAGIRGSDFKAMTDEQRYRALEKMRSSYRDFQQMQGALKGTGHSVSAPDQQGMYTVTMPGGGTAKMSRGQLNDFVTARNARVNGGYSRATQGVRYGDQVNPGVRGGYSRAVQNGRLANEVAAVRGIETRKRNEAWAASGHGQGQAAGSGSFRPSPGVQGIPRSPYQTSPGVQGIPRSPYQTSPGVRGIPRAH